MFGEWTETDRQTDRETVALNCEISTVWETEPRFSNQKNSGQLMGPEQELKPCSLYDDDDDDDDDDIIPDDDPVKIETSWSLIF